jgi:hypothetical protein
MPEATHPFTPLASEAEEGRAAGTARISGFARAEVPIPQLRATTRSPTRERIGSMTERLDELRKAAKLVAEGKSDQEVAVALGLSAAQIKRWRQNNPRFQRNLALRLVDPAAAANMDMLAEVGEELGKREYENP